MFALVRTQISGRVDPVFPTWAIAILVGVALGLAYVVVTTRRNGQREPNASGNVIERVDGPLRRPTRRQPAPTPGESEESMLEVHRLIDAGRKAEAVALLQRVSNLSVTDATARVDMWSLMSSRRSADMAETDY